VAVLRSFSKDTLLYGVGNAIKKFIGFLLLPFYSKAISPEEYGIVETIGSFTMLLTIFISFQIVDAGSRYYYDAKSKDEKGVILFTVFVICLLSIIPCMVISFFSGNISQLIFNSTKYTDVIVVSIMAIPLTIINDEQSWIYRYKRLPMKFNVYIIARSLLNISFGVLLVLYLKKSILGIQLASFLSTLIVVIFSLVWFARHEYTFTFSKTWALKMFKFSAPLIFSVLLSWAFTLLDRFLLLDYKSSYDVGIYSIGSAFARPISVLNMAIGMSFYPFFMSLYEKDISEGHIETKEKLNKIWDLYLLISLSLCGLLSVFGTNIISFVTTPEYLPGASVIPVLIISGIVRQSIDIVAIGLFLKEKTIHYTWLVGISTVVSILLNILLIPKYGYLGAAITNLISTAVYFAICYIMSQKYFHVSRNFLKPAIYLFLISSISFLIPFFEVYRHYDFHIGYKSIAFIGILIVPFLLRIVSISYCISVYKSIFKRA